MSPASRADSCRLAFVHDWLTGMRGGEKVLHALCTRYPHADIFTLVHVRGSVSPVIERHRIRRSVVGALPGIGRYYRHCLPLFPTVIEQFDLDGYDLVVSTSHCAAKSVVTSGRTRHLCYCFTPMRYAWDQFEAYFGVDRLGPLSRAMRLALRRLARWDAATSARPDRYVSISQHVANRIGRYYNRRSAIVYPPVETDFFVPAAGPAEPFALVVSALVPYKRVDLAIDGCRAAGMPLVIVGQGPERARLEQRAAGHATFLGAVSDDEVRSLYQRATLVLLPGEEDFGIVPVEAQACGRPVVALARGGAVETVRHGTTGLLVDTATPQGFADAIAAVRARSFDADVIRAHAVTFSTSAFLAGIERQIDDLLAAPASEARW